ncbi:DUF5723 family protein [Flagellimonas sp.]|uniref:DUF5723 family protein n=1 Tax=Flagellimonas sp. TaxID=2058762 RepID=UPI003B5A13D6
MYLKKLLLAAMFICLSNLIKAQSYSGFLTDNYNGVHGIISNPANIADSRVKLDINLIGISAFFGNDYIGFKLKDALSDDYAKVFDEAKTFPSANNSLAWNVDVLGPSVMFTLNEKSSIALFTRARAFFNLNDVDGTLIDKEGGFDEDEDFSVDEGVISGTANLWAEIGVTYAQVLMNKDEHFIKGGVSLKYLQSAGHAYLYANSLTVDYNAATRFVNTTGELVYGNSESFNDGGSFELDNGRGFGADLGLVYEWRPDHANYTKLNRDGNKIPDRGKNKYKLKFGLSVTDLGQIKNKNSVEDTYNLNGDQDIDNFDGDDLEDALQENFSLVQSTSSQNSILPTALHTNADWNMGSNFYLNLNMDMPLTTRNKINTNRVLSEFALTPRYESNWLSFYSPLRLVQYAGVQWGAGLRAGPIYVGSGSIMSVLLGGTSKSFDLYAGLKLPFYQSRLRDKDNDGIENNSDNCPEVPGPVENNGCPWPDTDGDGTLDKDDNCPQEAGPEENIGCPWPDTDGDGILDKDDDCPNKPGSVEHNGCPDSDGDGLIDKNDRCPNKAGKIEDKGCPDMDGDTLVDIDDLCPNKPGPVDNNGCPVVTIEVQKQLNTYARTILFDTGKATIKTESVSTMVDIIQILKEYPNAKFTVEGHTDSVGSASSNQKLSEARANSVKDFLIKEGIAADRLNAIGYGEENPIASNATRSGRKQNRRVEINLIK